MGQGRNKPSFLGLFSLSKVDRPPPPPLAKVGSAPGAPACEGSNVGWSRKRGVGGPPKFPESITPRKAARAGAERDSPPRLSSPVNKALSALERLNSRCGPRPIPSRLLPSRHLPPSSHRGPWGDAALGEGEGQQAFGTPVWGQESASRPGWREGHAHGVPETERGWWCLPRGCLSLLRRVMGTPCPKCWDA